MASANQQVSRPYDALEAKRINSSAERNRDPILQVLKNNIPLDIPIRALEIASGSGTHVGYLAEHLPNVTWQPSDCDSVNLPSLAAYKQEKSNILDPVVIDVSGHFTLEDPNFDIILAINMIHISPWTATLGLFSNSGQILKPGGMLITYGPYSLDGVLEPESNQNFDQSLRGMNEEWGIRDIRDLEGEAARERLELIKVVDMPANNKMLIFQRL